MSDSSQKQVSQWIDQQRAELAEAIVDEYYQYYPELTAQYGTEGKKFCLQDVDYHLTYLAEAIAVGHPTFFANYIAWAKVLLNGMNISSEELANSLQIVQSVLERRWQPAHEEIALIKQYIAHGLDQLPVLPAELPSFIEDAHPQAQLAQQYLEYLLRGERHIASQLILDAVEKQDVSVKEIYLNVFQYAQYEIGRLWQMNKISVAQEHYCTAATQLIMSQLYVYIFSTERQDKTLVATCVGGDLHELGVRMVADFFEMAGWDTYYLGANTPANSILQELETRQAHLLAISVTMTFHLRAAKNLIQTIRADDNFSHLKIMIGGHPFNLEETLWQEVGADAYARNAQEAIDIANQLC